MSPENFLWRDPCKEIRTFDHDLYKVLRLIAPRAFLLMGGGKTSGGEGGRRPESWPHVKEALRIYRHYGEPRRLGLFLHGAGHNVPPVAEHRAYRWLLTYL